MFESNLFGGLSTEECNQFIKFAKPQKKSFKKEAVLCYEGSIVNAFCIVLSGRLNASKYRYDGTLDLIEIYKKDDIVNLDTICTPTRISPIQISAMDDSEVVFIDYKIFDEINKSGSEFNYLQKNITTILANENIRKLYKIDVLYKKSLRERIMVYLLHMEDHLERSDFHIKMDREQFAQYLGVNRSALSHELSKMRKEGIINFNKDYFQMLTPK